jgi:hypothetical protein
MPRPPATAAKSSNDVALPWGSGWERPAVPGPSGDGLIAIATDGTGMIREIIVRRPGVFTQRYIVIGQSTLGEVLQRYGRPTSSRRVGPRLVIDYAYDGISFAFPYSGNAAGLENDVSVSAATVHTKAAPPNGASFACKAALK